MLLLVSTKSCDLWEGLTPEVCNSQTSPYSVHAQSQVWQIWLAENTKHLLCTCSENWTFPEVVILCADQKELGLCGWEWVIFSHKFPDLVAGVLLRAGHWANGPILPTWRDFKAIHGLAPVYISELISFRDVPLSRYCLHSTNSLMLNYPVLKSCKTLGDRSFFVAARKLWNELPSDIRDLNSINKFKTAIKTYLLDKPFYSVKFDALYIYIYLIFFTCIYIFKFTFAFVFLYICIKIIL